MPGVSSGMYAQYGRPEVYDPAADRARAAQAQEGQLRLASLVQEVQANEEARAQRANVRAALPGAVGADGTVNYSKLGQIYLNNGDLEGYTKSQTAQAAQAKAQRDQRTADLDYRVKAFDAVDRAAAGVKALPPEQQAAAWSAARHGLSSVLDPETLSELPEQIDGPTLDRLHLMALDGKGRAAEEQQAWQRQHQEKQFTETQRSNRVSESQRQQQIGISQGQLAVARQREQREAVGGGPQGFRTMTAAEKRDMGLPEKGVYQVNGRGQVSHVAGTNSASGNLTEGQAKATGLYRSASAAAKTLNDIDGKGWDPSIVAQELSSGKVGGSALGQLNRRAYNAFRALAAASLRLESGAAITPTEINEKALQIVPLPGDGAEVLADKRAQREAALAALRDAGGPGTAALPRVTKPSKPSSPGGWSIQKVK